MGLNARSARQLELSCTLCRRTDGGGALRIEPGTPSETTWLVASGNYIYFCRECLTALHEDD
jgi:hypothetical protein